MRLGAGSFNQAQILKAQVRLGLLPAVTTLGAKAALERIGRELVASIRVTLSRPGGGEGGSSAPGGPPHSRTGTLSRSYYYKASRLSLEVGATAEYAGFLEFGTSKMAARPALRPAIENYATADPHSSRYAANMVTSIVAAQRAASGLGGT